VANAIAYSPEGSTVAIIPHIADDGRARVTVRDEGPGISAEQAAHIFEKFERLGRDSAGGTDKGSGLGLYIARLLARAMGGELAVTSAPGEGAAFTLDLPPAG
jgi:signal transduction histidine kinase